MMKQIAFAAFAVTQVSAFGGRIHENRVSTQVTPAHCPAEWSFAGGRCYKQKFAEPTAYCPHGAELHGIDCVTATPQVMACPAGSYYSGHLDACAEEIRAAEVPYCAEGHDLTLRDGVHVCQRIIETTSTPYCESGLELFGDRCWKKNGYHPQRGCGNSNHRLIDGFCHFEEEVDCASINSVHRMLLGKRQSSLKCRRSVKRAAVKLCAEGRLIGDNCVHNEPEPLAYKCSGVCSVETTCRHVETRPALHHCPAGYNRKCYGAKLGKSCHCVAEAEIESIYVCPNGYLLAGDGLCVQSFPAAVHCPEDFNLDGNRCVQTCYSEARVVYVPTIQTCTTC